jgi:hypothetical protein
VQGAFGDGLQAVPPYVEKAADKAGAQIVEHVERPVEVVCAVAQPA